MLDIPYGVTTYLSSLFIISLTVPSDFMFPQLSSTDILVCNISKIEFSFKKKKIKTLQKADCVFNPLWSTRDFYNIIFFFLIQKSTF
uniref:Uncharacterized protein n=1 Tax=Octopus bimaculoides TaxID=37653 RepID=A0A0L8FR70_OCTBM